MLLFDKKPDEPNDTMIFTHEAIVSGRCCRLFFASKLFRVLCQQDNVYWPGIFMVFCRSPLCMDDGKGVVRFGKWPDPENPIVVPCPGKLV